MLLWSHLVVSLLLASYEQSDCLLTPTRDIGDTYIRRQQVSSSHNASLGFPLMMVYVKSPISDRFSQSDIVT